MRGKVRVGALLLAGTLLGGCAGSLADCLDRGAIVSTKQASDLLPDGCRYLSSSATGVARVDCADGRQGFAVGIR